MPKRKGWEEWGLRFRAACRENDLSTREVADRLGLAESSVRSWLNGTRQINLSDFFRLCDAACIEPASILFAGQTDARLMAIGQVWHQTNEQGKALLAAASVAARSFISGGSAGVQHNPHPRKR